LWRVEHEEAAAGGRRRVSLCGRGRHGVRAQNPRPASNLEAANKRSQYAPQSAHSAQVTQAPAAAAEVRPYGLLPWAWCSLGARASLVSDCGGGSGAAGCQARLREGEG
jgi:hypothetical protein